MTAIPRRPASVALNGDRVRQLREQKGLTQLYIAEVVGVSVDTVSRWENQRTQTVRADNVRALAAALEVAVEELVAVPPEPLQPPGSEAPRRKPRWLLAATLVAGLAAAGAGAWLWWGGPPELEAVRRLPAYTAPGTLVPVVIRARVVSGEVGMVVLREQIPTGWEFVGAVPAPDQGPDSAGGLRWIVPVKGGRAGVGYVVRAPIAGKESSVYRFTGEVVTAGKAGRTVAVKGAGRIDLEYIHWADEDGDFRIGDGEVLDALERLESVPGLGLDSSDLRALWGAGEYRWDRQAASARLPSQSAQNPAPETAD